MSSYISHFELSHYCFFFSSDHLDWTLSLSLFSIYKYHVLNYVQDLSLFSVEYVRSVVISIVVMLHLIIDADFVFCSSLLGLSRFVFSFTVPTPDSSNFKVLLEQASLCANIS